MKVKKDSRRSVVGQNIRRVFGQVQSSIWSIWSSSPVKGTAPSPIKEPPQEPSSHHHYHLHRSKPTIPSPVTIATINHKQELNIKGGWLTQISLFRKIYCASQSPGIRPSQGNQTTVASKAGVKAINWSQAGVIKHHCYFNRTSHITGAASPSHHYSSFNQVLNSELWVNTAQDHPHSQLPAARDH